MTEILLAVSPSVFSWSMLGRGSFSAAFLRRPCYDPTHIPKHIQRG